MKEDNHTRGTGTDKDTHEVRHRAAGATTGVTGRLREAVIIRITIEAITTEDHILLLRTVEDLEVLMGITVLIMTVTILGTTAGEVVILHLTMATADMAARQSHTQIHPKGKLGTAKCSP